ncbi:type 2 lanthipeptide synthetase LanM family protein [Myxococcus hansupus]|nr:type 2 lanthipeptide synthetase LanM family protein [Myxococcus hansupus]
MSQWVLGHFLEERLPSLRDVAASPPVDEARAKRRLERWRRQEPLSLDSIWAQRLRTSSVTEQELHTLLGEPAEALRERMGSAPPWMTDIERAYAGPPAEPLTWPQPTPPGAPLLALVEPLVHTAHARLLSALADEARKTPDAPFTPDRAAHMLLAPLPRLLLPLLGRALAVELHAAQLEDRLQGTTSEARFQDFVRQLRHRAVALDILGRYPVLARQAVERIASWEHASLELMQRLAQDAPALWRHFNGGEAPGRLVEVQGGLSDPHRGGRSVSVLRFESGLQLVYKPRPLAAEAAFQHLLAWLNARGLTPSLRTVEVLPRDDYGWMEFVRAAPCDSAEAVRRFHERQGGLIALLYAMDVIDMHYENLIAAGEHPVLVDLETLFHPYTLARSMREVESQPGTVLDGTVLKSGLLPQPIWRSRDGTEVDFSALGNSAPQLTPLGYLMPKEHGTDRLRFERRRLEIPAADNRPRHDGQSLAAAEHMEALSTGFTHMYRLLTEHRDALLASEGPLDAFAGAPTRVLFRDTTSYGALLHESLHPHALGDALDRQRFFDHLWLTVKERPYLETLIPLEQEELQRGDVPHFTTLPGSRDLWSGTGRHLPGFFDDTGLERARRRLEHLSPEDHLRQTALLRSTLDRVRLTNPPAAPRPSYAFREASEPAHPEALLAAARRISERVVALSFSGAGHSHWLSLDFMPSKELQLVQAGVDLYQGLPGIALALGYLGALTSDERLTHAARGAVRHLAWRLEEAPTQVRGIGILNGWGGILYALAHLGALWRDASLHELADALLDHVAPEVEQDEHLDLGAGSAGSILALLALCPSDKALRLARTCGERLVQRAQPQAHGVGWPAPSSGGQALCGLSHGTAGIALALLRLSSATGEARFRATALAALEYERSLYSPVARNWPDLRENTGTHGGGGGPSFMYGWCNGAPGIGLARVAGLPLLDDATVREEVSAAVSVTLERGFGSNHGLCHGDLGNALFLLEAARALRDDDLLHRTYRIAGGILQSLDAHGPLHGLPGSIETPGLMVGLSGIAYGLARLAAPEPLPDLLSVAPPGT